MNLGKPEREAMRKTAPISNPLVETVKKLRSALSTSLHNIKSDTLSLTNPREEELLKKAILGIEYRKAEALAMIRRRAIL